MPRSNLFDNSNFNVMAFTLLSGLASYWQHLTDEVKSITILWSMPAPRFLSLINSDNISWRTWKSRSQLQYFLIVLRFDVFLELHRTLESVNFLEFHCTTSSNKPAYFQTHIVYYLIMDLRDENYGIFKKSEPLLIAHDFAKIIKDRLTNLN